MLLMFCVQDITGKIGVATVAGKRVVVPVIGKSDWRLHSLQWVD